MLEHWIWFVNLQRITPGQKRELLKMFSDPEDLYHSELEDGDPNYPPQVIQALSEKDLTQAYQIVRQCKEKNIRAVTYGDKAYPEQLRSIGNPPLVLYYKGTLPYFDAQPVIGVVGTRKATATGKSAARDFSRELAACGALVISGGAAGIDSEAHQGALAEGAPTVAVLGCGADVIFPKTNRKLFEKIEENGCLISEYPPGTPALSWHFPERNRIISGLSNGILVVEAPEKSGALITARTALEQGRDVFAVPGAVNNYASAGSNALLREGAGAVLAGWDIMKEYESQYPSVKQRRPTPKMPEAKQIYKVATEIQLPFDDKKSVDNSAHNAYSVQDSASMGDDPLTRKLLQCLGPEPVPVDDVIAQVQAPAAEVLSKLTKMALLGIVLNHPGRMVSLKRK